MSPRRPFVSDGLGEQSPGAGHVGARPTTSYVGGPLDGQTTLGRLRPEPVGSLNAPTWTSGPPVHRLDYAGGEYRRTSADATREDPGRPDVYEWTPDEPEPEAA
jgi:hypothetical protein